MLDKLEAHGLADNTLIVSTNDNGGATIGAFNNDPLSGVKATHLEGRIRVPFVIKWDGKLKVGSHYTHPISLFDLLPTFGDAADSDPAALEGVDGVSLLPYLNVGWVTDHIKLCIGKRKHGPQFVMAIGS